MIDLKNMDCLEAMKQMDDNQFDLAIVDPPYGIDLANMNMGAGKSKKCSKIKNRKWSNKDWDKQTPSKDYFNELFRVSKNQIIWGGNYFDLPPCPHYIIWDKEIPNGLSFADCEMAWTSYKKAPRMFRESAYKDKKNKIHPTQKPVKLYEWILDNYANEGEKILDTHLGSGSIALACHNRGFNLTGFEIDKEYFDNAVERLRVHQSQLTIF